MTRCTLIAICLLGTGVLWGARGASAQEQPAEPPPSAESFKLELLAGAGIGTRAFQRPLDEGLERLDDSLFPAVEAGARVRVLEQERFGLEALLRYQSSIGFSIEQRPWFAPANEVGVRAERVELSLAPRLSLGEPKTAPAILLPIGCSLRTLWPDEHERGIAGYSLLGPQLRAEVQVPIGERLALRAGPEAQWIVGIDAAVRKPGLESTGLALGFEAMVQLRVLDRLAIELAYRQSRARVAGKSGIAPLYDFERFVTLRLAGAL